MRILKNKVFSRYARRAGLQDSDLCHAVTQADQGIVDADLGGGVIKQRIARLGEGKSGGFRTIVLFRTGQTAFFVYGFAKNERSNIQAGELTAFRKLAAEVLAYDEAAITQAVKAKVFVEIFCEQATESAEVEEADAADKGAADEEAVQKQNNGGNP